MNTHTSKQQIFMMGGTGYIGGSFLHLMLSRGYLHRFDISVLVRDPLDAERLARLGVTPILGDLDDHNVLKAEAEKADIVFSTANCDHCESVVSVLAGQAQYLKTRGKRSVLIHTSGAGVLTASSAGTGVSPAEDRWAVEWDDANQEQHAHIPPTAPHRFVDLEVFAAAEQGLVNAYLVVPPTVFGRGVGPLAEHRMSIQIPRLIYRALMDRQATHVGRGENVWPNVHVADLAELYLLILENALAQSMPVGGCQLFYPVTEHFTWSDVSQRIAKRLHAQQLLPQPTACSGLAAGWFWGSNVRVVSSNAAKLGWKPHHGGTQAMLDSVEDDLALVLAAIRERNV